MKIRIDTPKINLKPGIQKVSPALEDLEVNPSSIEQVFNHPNSYGYDTVTVKAVEADELNVTPTTQNQEYTGLYGTVNVSAVNSSIDSDIQANNIKQGVNILGVEGNVEELNGEEITVKSTSQEQIILPSENKNAFTKITVQPIINEYEWFGNSTNFSLITLNPKLDKFTYKETNPSRLTIAAGYSNAANYSTIADDIFFTFRTMPTTYTVALNSQALRGNMAKKIGFGVSLSSTKTMSLMFYQCTNLEEIYGEPFDTSGIANSNSMPNFDGCSNLKKIIFKENTTKFNIKFNASPLLENNTLISIANGLNESVTSQTLTLHATPKAKCSNIMGTVDSTTYDYKVFVPSESGTMSLEEFITTEKGWTLS